MEPVCTCGHAADEHGPLGLNDTRRYTMGCHVCDCILFISDGGEELEDDEEELADADDREDGPDFPLDEPAPDGDAAEELGEAATEVDITVIPRGDA